MLRRKPREEDAIQAAEPSVDVGETTGIGAIVPRQFVRVVGTIVLIKSRPGHGLPALSVVLGDETGRAMVLWTGRRSLGGITLGRRLLVEGVAARRGGSLEFTNPVYTLLPRHA